MTKILLVEDNLEIRENTQEILELSGFQVSSAANGKIGASMCMKILPDLILCDVHMPEMNGDEVFRYVKAHPVTANIPFVFVTSSAEKKEMELALAMGADAYVCKPFESEELLITINRVLLSTHPA